jgi:hypothetical protein
MIDPSDDADRQLEIAAALAEQRFLAAGESLEQALGILDRLTARFGDYIAELTGQALEEMRDKLASAGRDVATLADARHADADILATLGDIVAATGQRVAALHPITHEVETLSLSASVVAGGMGQAAADFSAFAGNIRSAAQQARASLTGAHDALGQVDQHLATARREAEGFVQQHGATLQAIPARLADNLRSLAAQQQLATDAATDAHRQSDEVRRQVAGQIVALQVGDITRQRLEHVQTASRALRTTQPQAGDLLAAQLLDAADDLVRNGERIETGLRQLGIAAGAIGQLGVQVHGDFQGGGFVAALEADIHQTADLLSGLGTDEEASERRMALVLDAIGVLSARLVAVQSVQEDIRIMGLNASLKCGRLGAIGRPLAAVAQELRLCSGRFEASATSVLRDLGRIKPMAAALRDPSRRGRRTELAEATDELVAPLRRLHLLRTDLADTLSRLSEDATEVRRLVDAALAQFEAHHVLAATLKAVAETFVTWPNAAASSRAVLDDIAASYTMAREREVHARFAPLPETAPRQEKAQQGDELADVLF